MQKKTDILLNYIAWRLNTYSFKNPCQTQVKELLCDYDKYKQKLVKQINENNFKQEEVVLSLKIYLGDVIDKYIIKNGLDIFIYNAIELKNSIDYLCINCCNEVINSQVDGQELALQLLEQLINDFCIKDIYIYGSYNWGCVALWAKDVIKLLTDYTDTFNLDRCLGFNDLSLIYVDKVVTPSSSSDAQVRGQFVASIGAIQLPHPESSTWQHEYFHYLDYKCSGVYNKSGVFFSEYVLLNMFGSSTNRKDSVVHCMEQAIAICFTGSGIDDFVTNNIKKRQDYCDSVYNSIVLKVFKKYKKKWNNLNIEKKKLIYKADVMKRLEFLVLESIHTNGVVDSKNLHELLPEIEVLFLSVLGWVIDKKQLQYLKGGLVFKMKDSFTYQGVLVTSNYGLLLWQRDKLNKTMYYSGCAEMLAYFNTYYSMLSVNEKIIFASLLSSMSQLLLKKFNRKL